jgi:nucleoside-diphosphate-sugar epimerase
MSKVLVTGASGFVGRHTLPFLLKKGYEVSAVGRGARPDFLDSQISWHTADLLDTTSHAKLFSTTKPTYLLHLAWYAIPGKYWTSHENFYWTQASLSLARHFREVGGQHLVCAGTCAEYDWSNGSCLEDDTPLKSSSPYSICKNTLQELLALYSRQTEMSFSWGRIFFVYGPHEPFSKLVSSVILLLKDGKSVPCSHGKQLRDYIYIKDVAAAFVRLLNTNGSGPVNISSGNPVSIKHVVEFIAKAFGREELIQWGAIPTPENDPPLLVGDNRKLQACLEWGPEYTLEKGLAETIQFYSNNRLDV